MLQPVLLPVVHMLPGSYLQVLQPPELQPHYLLLSQLPIRHNPVVLKSSDHALEHEETNLMVNCIAVSLDYNNAPIAALSVSIPTFRISGEKEKEVVQILWEAKHRIEAHFQVYGVDFGN
jgi:hypothetical protein